MAHPNPQPVTAKLVNLETTQTDLSINSSGVPSKATSRESCERAAVDNEEAQPEWKPNSREWLTLVCLGIVSMVVALDTNILVPVLPVSQNIFSISKLNQY
jgi:uncharacterized protein YqhQ